MKATTLFRLGGLSLVLGGLLGPLGHLVLHPPSHALQYQGTPQWVLAHSVLTVSWVLILFGVVALYGRHYERMGVIGLIGFALVCLVCLYQVASYAFDAFTLPAIRTTFPGETATGPNGSFDQFPNGLFPVPLSFPIGLILFGVAIFRSGLDQRWSGIALAASVVLIYAGGALAHSPVHLELAIPIVFSVNALVFAWLGYGLVQEMRAGPQRVTPAPDLISVQTPSAR
jgi:hypothetical protein